MKEPEIFGHILAFAAYALILFGIARCIYAGCKSGSVHLATALFLSALFAAALAIVMIYDSKSPPPIAGKAVATMLLPLALISIFGHFLEKGNKKRSQADEEALKKQEGCRKE